MVSRAITQSKSTGKIKLNVTRVNQKKVKVTLDPTLFVGIYAGDDPHTNEPHISWVKAHEQMEPGDRLFIVKNKEQGKVLVSETVLLFLVEWLAWATSEDPKRDKFSRYRGLCSSFLAWCRHTGRIYEENALSEAFIASRLDEKYPFGEDNFDTRLMNDTQHLDPARLAWVRKVIKDNRGAK